jgi:hypothetical protein
MEIDMRTVEEIRSRYLDSLRIAVKRPLMWGGTAVCTESSLRSLLPDLLFIDEREADWDVAARFLHGPYGARGQLEDQKLPFPDFVNEVASICAEAAFALGYFTPERLLSGDEMSRLCSALTPDFMSRDLDEHELHVKFGPPSHEVVGGDTTVACYACVERDAKWVFFDLDRRLHSAEDRLTTLPVAIPAGRLDDPHAFWGSENWLFIWPAGIVRDVRKDLTNKMHLLPFGKRWVETGGTGP